MYLSLPETEDNINQIIMVSISNIIIMVILTASGEKYVISYVTNSIV